jgi:MFS family permease
VSAGLRRSFASLKVPNYRRYFAGQVVSLSGNWIQIVAEVWLIVALTGSGFSVGVAAALQFLPLLLFAPLGGVLADRYDKRRLLLLTQSLMVIPAVAMLALTATGVITVGMVYALILLRGLLLAVDNPARQSFVSELVGSDRVVNAVALNSVMIHTARLTGPAIAGVLIAFAGLSFCFALNALSYVAMLIALVRMAPEELDRSQRSARERGQVREALAEVRRRPELRIPLGMMVAIGTLTFNFQVLLPLLARFTWDGDATLYAALTSAMGVGAIVGALVAGARGRVAPGLLVVSALAFGATTLAAAAAPTLPVQLAVLILAGAASVTFAAGVNSSLQLAAAGPFRGRVMSLYTVVFLGSTAVGAPLVGWLAELAGPRAGLVLGGAAAVGAAAWGAVAYARAGLLGGDERGERGAVAAAGLGVVERAVGGVHQGARVRVGAALEVDEAHGDRDLRLRGMDALAQRLRHGDRGLGAHATEQDRELVAADPGDGIRRP